MRLYQQLVLFMLAATVLPLVVVGFWLLRTAERELASQIGNEQRALASLAAERSSEQLAQVIDNASKSVDLVNWSELNDDERRPALSLVYSASPWISAAALVDKDGKDLASPVFFSEAREGHPPFSADALAALKSSIPLAALVGGARGQAVVGDPYKRSDGAVALALSVKTAEPAEAPFVLLEVSLRALSADLERRVAGTGHRIDVVGGGDKIFASSSPELVLTPLEPELQSLEDQIAVKGAPTAIVKIGAARYLVTGSSSDGNFGLVALVRQNHEAALAPVSAMRRTVLFGIGVALVVLLAFGALFTRRLNSRLGTVVKGVEALGKGELSTRVPVSGSDELTELATTFNSMGGELEKARAKLLTWNEELKQKVEEATADLRAAQAQLVEAQKLAAVGQLGAGVAHEINNPLAGILGNAQLLMLDRAGNDPDFETLKKIEQSAKRCKEITQNLLRFSQQKDKMEPRPIDLNGIIKDSLKLSASQSESEGVTLVTELSPQPVRVNGDPGQLVQVVVAMIANGRTAVMKATDKKLTLRTRQDGNSGVIEISDSGKGIKPEHLPRIFEPFFTTKDVWTNVGLGLSVAYRVINEHKGKIEVQTEVGKGTTFTVRVPLYDPNQKVEPRAEVTQSGPSQSGPLSWTTK